MTEPEHGHGVTEPGRGRDVGFEPVPGPDFQQASVGLARWLSLLNG